MRLPDLGQLAAEQLQAAVYALDKGAPAHLVQAHAQISIAATLQRIAATPARAPDRHVDTIERNNTALLGTLHDLIARVDRLEDDQPSERLAP